MLGLFSPEAEAKEFAALGLKELYQKLNMPSIPIYETFANTELFAEMLGIV